MIAAFISAIETVPGGEPNMPLSSATERVTATTSKRPVSISTNSNRAPASTLERPAHARRNRDLAFAGDDGGGHQKGRPSRLSLLGRKELFDLRGDPEAGNAHSGYQKLYNRFMYCFTYCPP